MNLRQTNWINFLDFSNFQMVHTYSNESQMAKSSVTHKLQELMSPPPPCLDTGVVASGDVISDTYQISKVLDSALKRLAETTTGRSSSPVWNALDSLPELESLPVQVGLLTLCCQPGFHAKTMEDFITLGSVGQTEDVSKIGSNAVLKVLEGMPLTEFLQLASEAVHSISDSMVADNAKLVLDVTHALETKVIHDIVDRE